MDDEDRGFFDDSSTAFERAVHERCASGHGDPNDAAAVLSALGGAPVGTLPPAEVGPVAAAWIDAARTLRQQDLPRTLATVGALVAAGDGFPARHARQLIDVLIDVDCANDWIEEP